LPACFKGATISYHTEKSWKEGYFQSAARGQEFVIQENVDISKWAESLFDEETGCALESKKDSGETTEECYHE
jgi:hypothetical protein